MHFPSLNRTFAVAMTKLFFAILPLMVCSLWAIHLLLDYVLERSIITLRLLLFVLTTMVLYAGHSAFFLEAYDLIPFTDTLYGMANMAVYPMYLLYIIQLTQGRLYPRQWLFLVPSVLCGLLYTMLYVSMDETELSHFIGDFLYDNSLSGLMGLSLTMAWVHQIFKLAFLLQVLLCGWFGFRYLHRFEKHVSEVYADIEGRTLRPVHFLLVIFLFTSLLSVVSSFVGRYRFLDSVWLLAIPSTVFSVLLYVISYIGSRSMFSYVDYQAELRLDEHSSLTENMELEAEVTTKVEQIAHQIERLMKEEDFYLKPDLRLGDVANKLGTNVKYVSMAFNQVIGTSFSDYVNRKRIAHALEMQSQQPHLSAVEIARQSGYISMQSFYRNLKKFS